MMRIVLLILLLSVASVAGELRGRVVGANGQPIENALVSVRAALRGTGTRYGVPDDVDARARTDPAGNFVLRGKNPFLALTITVEGAGHAKGIFSDLRAGESVHELRLSEGVTAMGTLRDGGLPVANAEIVIGSDRSSKIFTFEASGKTDANGRFEIRNLPPRRDCFLYGTMASLEGRGTLAARPVRLGSDRTLLNLGELNLEPGFAVEGRVEPAVKTKVTLGRDAARDELEVTTDEHGAFRFSHAPGEIVTLRAEIAGMRLSSRNASLNPAEPNHLIGKLLTNETALVMEFESGAALDPLQIDANALKQEPLRGIEPAGRRLGWFEVKLTVTNAADFVVSEGRIDRRGGLHWFLNRRHSTNVILFPGQSAPVIFVESPDHLTFSQMITNSAALVIGLEKGVKTAGVVTDPNGKPAPGAKVYLTDLAAVIYMDGPPGNIPEGKNRHVLSTKTDTSGRFAFKPVREAANVIVEHGSGFANAPAGEAKIELKPWSRVEGILKIGSAPATNEIVRLNSAPRPYEWFPRELPALSATFLTRTDENGRFVFERVPPIMVEVAHSPPRPDVALGPVALTQSERLSLKPGETVRVELGGKGRMVLGRFEVADYGGTVSWASSAQTMENIIAHKGPSDAAMIALADKLRQVGRTNLVERKRAEEAYYRERDSFAAETRKFFATAEGEALLMATRRYHIQFADDGSFRIEDVPAGKYRVELHLINSDPEALGTRRSSIANFTTEISVPEGSEPLDLGLIRIPRPAQR